MARRVLSSGMLALSAVALSAQPSTPQTIDGNDCGNDPTSSPCVENPRQTEERHSSQTASPTIDYVSPSPFNLQWSDRQSHRVPSNMEAIYGEMLEQAQVEADSDRLTTAVATAAGIPRNSRHYAAAQNLQEDWSQELFQYAASHYQQGDMDAAMDMINSVPPTSEINTRVAELRERWTQQSTVFDRAIAARNANSWEEVIAILESLEGTPFFHSLPVQELLQQAMNKLFEPDQSMLQVAFTAPIPDAPRQITPPTPDFDTLTSDSFASPLESADLPVVDMPIDLDQAIAWAQPSNFRDSAVASLPTRQPQMETAQRDRYPSPQQLAMMPSGFASKSIASEDLSSIPFSSSSRDASGKKS